MRGLFDLAYAFKAWAAGAVAAVGAVLTGWQVAAADEAITFDEARGLWLLVTQAATVLAGIVVVFRSRPNAPAPKERTGFRFDE